jgi:selenocysteine lyase/cysteine desulfurase
LGVTVSDHLDTPIALRACFPRLAEVAYLNTAGAGLSSVEVADAAAAFHRDVKAKGLEGQPEWSAKTDAVRRHLAVWLHVEPDDLGFHGSCTEAMNLLAVSIAEPEHFVIVADHDDHPAVWAPWIGAASRGVRVQFPNIPRGAPREEALMAAASRVGAHAIALSHVDWRSGARIDLENLSAFCRARDILLFVDGSQAAGAIPVNATPVDAYLGSTFKWLLAGFGLGYMALSPGLKTRLVPGFRGSRNAPPSRDLRYGHINLGGIYELGAGLGLLDAASGLGLSGRPADLAGLLRARLLDDGQSVITPDATAGIVALECDDSERVALELRAQGVSVQSQPGALRASAHVYNSEADIERYVRALQAIHPARSGRRAAPVTQ